MTMNLIAMLLSLAMMLTGAGGAGQPAEASRNLVLHNLSVTCNGETVRPNVQARMGASTNGEKAVFDFGVELGEDKLLPIQVGVDEAGVTALFGGNDVAVTVTAKALEDAMETANALLGDMGEVDVENPELMNFLYQEFMPAYTGVLQAAMDTDQQREIQAQCQAVFDKVVDRGEGVPGVVEIDEENYDVTTYSYVLEGEQLAELSDAVYDAVPVLQGYYKALFKLYGMLPEESGLNGIDSFKALFEKFGLDMRMEIEEQINEKLEIDVMDAVLTMDMSAMIASQAQPVPYEFGAADVAVEPAEVVEDGGDGAEGEETVEGAAVAPVETTALEPIVMNLHSERVGDFNMSDVSCAYTLDGSGIEMAVSADADGVTQDFEMDVTVIEDGKKAGRCKLSLFAAADGEGGSSYSANLRTVVQDQARVDVNFYGMAFAGGTSENSVSFGLRTPEANVEVSFDLDVTKDAIEDLANGRENAFVIDDLSEAGLQSLSQDAAFQGAMLKVMGALSMDAAKLTGDSELKKLTSLLEGESLPINVDDINDEAYDLTYDEGDADEFTYVIDDDELAAFDDEPVEDDGVLPFNEPSFGWLPQGWKVTATDVDTAYDWVEMSIADENGKECAYAVFFQDPEEATTNYIVKDDGTVVDGREINVTDFDAGGLSVTLRDSGLYANMMFTSEAIDVETIGKIVAGMKF